MTVGIMENIMQLDHYTALMRNAIGEAQNTALAAGHPQLCVEQFLAALRKTRNIAVMLINRAGGDAEKLASLTATH